MPPGDDEKEEEESHSVAINETFLHLFIYAWFDFLFLVLFHRFIFYFFSSSLLRRFSCDFIFVCIRACLVVCILSLAFAFLKTKTSFSIVNYFFRK